MNKEQEKEIRGSFTTSVSFKMVCLYFWTWIIRGTITHRNIIIIKKEEE